MAPVSIARARVLAPAFIGAHSKIRASALVTRDSVIEHHAEVDCGTVVENSTILPFTYVGAGLDVMHSVVGFRRMSHLLRNVEVEIHDGKLVGMSPVSTVSRLAGSTAALFAVLPKQIYRGFLRAGPAKSRPHGHAGIPGGRQTSSMENPGVEARLPIRKQSEFPSNFAVVRRYGEH